MEKKEEEKEKKKKKRNRGTEKKNVGERQRDINFSRRMSEWSLLVALDDNLTIFFKKNLVLSSLSLSFFSFLVCFHFIIKAAPGVSQQLGALAPTGGLPVAKPNMETRKPAAREMLATAAPNWPSQSHLVWSGSFITSSHTLSLSKSFG